VRWPDREIDASAAYNRPRVNGAICGRPRAVFVIEVDNIVEIELVMDPLSRS
jgi:hypothetical protein